MRCLLVNPGVGRASGSDDDKGDSAKSKDSVKDGRVVTDALSSGSKRDPRYGGGGIDEGRCEAPALETLSTGLCNRLLLLFLSGSSRDDSAAAGLGGVGKEHARSLVTQLLQLGRCSSHLMCRLLHSKQPLRDLRWALRSLPAAPEPGPEPEPEVGVRPSAVERGGIGRGECECGCECECVWYRGAKEFGSLRPSNPSHR
jgi:hypothetical protein